MAKRNTQQIESDFLEIKKFVKSNPSVTSLNEIATAVEITVAQVKTSLSKHPRTYSNIQQLIEKNKTIESNVESKTMHENSEDNIYHQNPEAEKNSEKSVNFVIDASLMGIENLYYVLKKISYTGSKIILTSITIKELNAMQKYNDPSGLDARRILSMAATNGKLYKCIQIDESFSSHDECIIKYCANNKDNVILITCDKTMALLARTYDVKTTFLARTNNTSFVKSHFNCKQACSKINTLYYTEVIGEKLYISNMRSENRRVAVFSEGILYDNGMHELKIGDDVYVATKKESYFTFAHYRIISITTENNSFLVYSTRIYDPVQISNLPKANYKSFLRDFRRMVN